MTPEVAALERVIRALLDAGEREVAAAEGGDVMEIEHLLTRFGDGLGSFARQAVDEINRELGRLQQERAFWQRINDHFEARDADLARTEAERGENAALALARRLRQVLADHLAFTGASSHAHACGDPTYYCDPTCAATALLAEPAVVALGEGDRPHS
jgi:hypothetical protein